MLRSKAALGRESQVQAVILIGFMGAGKSSVGRALSRHLGWTFEDLDERIEQREGRKVHEIFRNSGEPGFRRAEQTALKELLCGLRAGAGSIVALGGGAFVQERNARLIKAADVATVFLDASVEELWRRCRQQADEEGMERPLLTSLSTFRELYDARRPHYSKAVLRQETSGKTVEQIVKEVVAALGLQQSRLCQTSSGRSGLQQSGQRQRQRRGEKQ